MKTTILSGPGRALQFGIALLGILSFGSIQAQQAALEEVVVTAEKREESLQDVSLAVSAFTPESLENANVTNLSELDKLTPGIVFGASGSSARPTMRGVPTPSLQIDADPSLGFHVDGIYRTREGQALAAMFDVERVEIHRGPQGTLFGRNTTGGNVNIISMKPQREFDAKVTAGYGNYDHLYAEGMVNVPVNDAFQTRLAVKHEYHDPYAKNIFLGGDHGANDKDEIVGRLSLRLRPNEDFDAILRLSYWDQGGQSSFNGYKSRGTQLTVPLSALPPSGTELSNNPASPIYKGNFLGPKGTPTETYVPVAGYFNNPTRGDEFRANEENILDAEEYSANLTLDWNITDTINLVSKTSFTDYDAFRDADNDFSPFDSRSIQFTTKSETFYQEVHLSSLYSDPFEWLIGFNYLHDKGFDNFSFFFEDGDPLQGILGEHFIDRDRTAETESWAVFGQAKYYLTDSLRVKFGGRYTEDDKTFDQLEIRNDGATTVIDTVANNQTHSDTFKQFTWKFGIDHFWAENNLLYASVATGFRSGGFNDPTSVQFNPAVPPTFGPETVISFEVGSKNSFLNDRLQLNLSAYHATYDDAHALQFDSAATASYTTNAAKVIAWGIEYEARALLTDRLSASLTGHLMDASYDEFNNCVEGFSDTVIDCTGNEVERSPRLKFALGVDYRIPLGDMGTLTPRVLFSYTDEYHNTAFNYDIDRQESYTETDISATWESVDKKWKVRAYIQNIEDEIAQIYGVVGGNGSMYYQGTAPRTYGVRATYNF